MRLLAHLLRFDARRLRSAIALWIVVAALSSLAASVLPLFGDQSAATAAALTRSLISLAGILLSITLVPLVVQAHPAVGSDAFWMTRPLPAGLVLGSKLLLTAVLFIAVPVLFQALRAAAHGVPAADVGLVAAESVMMWGLLLAALLVAAVLTRDLARFAMVCGAALLALAMVPTIAIILLRGDTPRLLAFISPSGDVATPLPATSSAAPMTMALIVVAGATAAAWVQYRARRIPHSAFVAASSLAVAILVGIAWPWPAAVEARPAPAWVHAQSALQLTTDAPSMLPEAARGFGDDVPRRGVRVPLRLTRAVPGWMASVRMLGGVLELGGVQHAVSERGNRAAVSDDTNEAAWPAAVGSALGVHSMAGATLAKPEDLPGLVLSVAAESLAGSSSWQGSYRGEFSIDLARLEIAAVLPLEPGASFQEGAYRFVLDRVRYLDGDVSLDVRISSVGTMLDRRSRPMYSYHLRHAPRSEAVSGVVHGGEAHVFLPLAGIAYSAGRESNGFSVSAQTVTFRSNPYEQTVEDRQRLVIDRAWLAGAELVILRATYDGSVARTLEVADLRFPGS